jgi:hypothetical protein
MLEKTKGSIKNVKLWGIGNIGHKTQTEGKQTNKQITKQKTKKMRNTNTTQNIN